MSQPSVCSWHVMTVAHLCKLHIDSCSFALNSLQFGYCPTTDCKRTAGLGHVPEQHACDMTQGAL